MAILWIVIISSWLGKRSRFVSWGGEGGGGRGVGGDILWVCNTVIPGYIHKQCYVTLYTQGTSVVSNSHAWFRQSQKPLECWYLSGALTRMVNILKWLLSKMDTDDTCRHEMFGVPTEQCLYAMQTTSLHTSYIQTLQTRISSLSPDKANSTVIEWPIKLQ